jgi:PAS domain S-box-containing protein
MKKINEIWQSLSNQGITDDMSSGKAKRIRLSNRLPMVVGLVLSPFIIQYYEMGLYQAIGIQVVTISLFWLCPLLNRWRFTTLTRYLQLIVGNFNIFFTSRVFGFDNGDHLGLVLVELGAFLLFSLKERTRLLAAVALPFVCLILIETPGLDGFEKATLEAGSHHGNYLTNLVLAVAVSGYIAYYFQGVSNRQVDEIIYRAQRELRAIFDNSYDAIFIVNLGEHRILECNERSWKMFGFSAKEDFMGRNINQLFFDPMSQETEQQIEARLLAGERWSEEGRFVHSPDGFFWGNVAFTFINYGEKRELLIRITDISERKAAEKAVLKAKEKAEEASRAKDNFLANMSHEIRTPINGIIGLAEIIGEESQSEEMEAYAEMVMESGYRLLGTLGSILDLTRLETADEEMELTVVSVNQLVQNAAAGIAEEAAQKGLYFHLAMPEEEINARLHESYCLQSLQHMLSNALKFTEEGGITLWVEGPAKGAESDFVSIFLADTGIGMRDEFIRTKLFMKFEQESEGLDRNFEGAGLGLSIVKRVVELMGGRISVVSEKGEGSTFRLDFPVIVSHATIIKGNSKK